MGEHSANHQVEIFHIRSNLKIRFFTCCFPNFQPRILAKTRILTELVQSLLSKQYGCDFFDFAAAAGVWRFWRQPAVIGPFADILESVNQSGTIVSQLRRTWFGLSSK